MTNQPSRDEMLSHLRTETPLIVQVNGLERKSLELVLRQVIDHHVRLTDGDVLFGTGTDVLKTNVLLPPELIGALETFLGKIDHTEGMRP